MTVKTTPSKRKVSAKGRTLHKAIVEALRELSTKRQGHGVSEALILRCVATKNPKLRFSYDEFHDVWFLSKKVTYTYVGDDDGGDELRLTGTTLKPS